MTKKQLKDLEIKAIEKLNNMSDEEFNQYFTNKKSENWQDIFTTDLIKKEID